MLTEPTVVERAAQPYLAIKESVTMPETPSRLPPLIGEVFGWLAERGIEPAGAGPRSRV